MNLLLDTHAWLWCHLGDPRLSQAAREHILVVCVSRVLSDEIRSGTVSPKFVHPLSDHCFPLHRLTCRMNCVNRRAQSVTIRA